MNIDGEKPDVIKLTDSEVHLEREIMKEALPRRFYIQQKDSDDHGYTAKRPGCSSILRKSTRQGHSEACRKRLEEAMKDETKVKTAKDKLDSCVADVLEKEDLNRKRAASSKQPDASGVGSLPEERKRRADAEDGGVLTRQRTENKRAEKRDREDDDTVDEQPRKVTVCGLEVNQEFDQAEGEWLGAQHSDEESNESRDQMFYDDRTGKVLKADLVRIAEREEIDFMNDLGVGIESTEDECWMMTGKPPVTTKFVRVNKGSDEEPDVRARLCARDFKLKGSGGDVSLFAAMPPLEAKKLLLRQAVRMGRVWKNGKWQAAKLLFIDVKKAHLNGVVSDDIYAYVKLPDGRVWRLKRWLYGMRPAASAWEADFTEKLESAGFVKGKSCPTVFYRASTGCRCVVHGDDFTFLALEGEIQELVRNFEKWYEIKVRGVLGGGQGDQHEITPNLTYQQVVLRNTLTPK